MSKLEFAAYIVLVFLEMIASSSRHFLGLFMFFFLYYLAGDAG